MKKNILIFCAAIAAFSLTALGYTNWSNTESDQPVASYSKAVDGHSDLVNASDKEADLDLYYDIGNRWSTMTKEELKKVKSILDILHEDGTYTREAYRNVTVSILHNDKDVRDIETSEMGQSELLNAAQLKLLNSSDYSTNLRITALSIRTNTKTGVVEDDSLVLYLTIIPEKEAEFTGGFNALTDYLKESSKEKVGIIEEAQLQPGKVFFTVTKKGTIENIKVVSTSGYSSVDKELVKVIAKMPEKWNPAVNSKGEKVDQEFVFFFGLEGCQATGCLSFAVSLCRS